MRKHYDEKILQAIDKKMQGGAINPKKVRFREKKKDEKVYQAIQGKTL